MEPTLQAREDVICLPFSCPSAPLPVVTVGEGVAGHVPAEQVGPVSFSGMPRQGRLEALPCDQGGLSSFWSQTDTEAPSICVRGTSHPGDSRGTGASWGYPVGIPQEGTLDIPPHSSALLLTEDKLFPAHVTSRLCVWSSQHSRVPWMWLLNHSNFLISLLSLLASSANSWLLQTLKVSSASTLYNGIGAQPQDFVNFFWKS